MLACHCPQRVANILQLTAWMRVSFHLLITNGHLALQLSLCPTPCMHQGCCEFAAAQQQPIPSSSNILLLVQGDVPPGEAAASTIAPACGAAPRNTHAAARHAECCLIHCCVPVSG